MDVIEFSINLPASAERVWDAWTTEKGVRGFFAPACRLEIEPGGRYEILFNPESPPGEQGSEGMKVLSVQKPTFLSFTWNAPPSMPAIREQRTWVEIHLSTTTDGCCLTLRNGGYGSGEEWEEARNYFVSAWGDFVLPRLESYLADGPRLWGTAG